MRTNGLAPAGLLYSLCPVWYPSGRLDQLRELIRRNAVCHNPSTGCRERYPDDLTSTWTKLGMFVMRAREQ